MVESLSKVNLLYLSQAKKKKARKVVKDQPDTPKVVAPDQQEAPEHVAQGQQAPDQQEAPEHVALGQQAPDQQETPEHITQDQQEATEQLPQVQSEDETWPRYER